MRMLLSVSLFMILPLSAKAGEPGTCSIIEGIWVGECIEEGKPRPAKLQIFQDGCTDIAFFDFDSPIPQVYKIGRESKVQSSKLADSFSTLTAYASWSEDRRTFQVSRLASSEYTENQLIRGRMEESYVVSLQDEEKLKTTLQGKYSSSNHPVEPYETRCNYAKKMPGPRKPGP